MSAQRGSATPSRKWSTHDRLLRAVTDVAALHGYANLTVARVLASSGVSRATFYQYFSDIEDCFRSAYRHHAEQFVTDITRRSGRGEPAFLTLLDAILEITITRPEVARMLMVEGLAAGPVGALERDALISRLEHVMTVDPSGRSKIDLPATILVGGIFRFLYMRLLEGDPCDGLRDEVLEWAGVFARRSPRPVWLASFAPALPPGPSRSFTPSRRVRLELEVDDEIVI